jgi:hypothetical protein
MFAFHTDEIPSQRLINGIKEVTVTVVGLRRKLGERVATVDRGNFVIDYQSQ